MVEHLPEKLGEGDDPVPVILGGSKVQVAADLGEALSDLEIASQHIDSSPTQCCRLTPSQRPIGEDINKGPVMLLDLLT